MRILTSRFVGLCLLLLACGCGSSSGDQVIYVENDIDGNGSPDIIAAAVRGGPANEGEVHIWFGPNFSNTANVVIRGEAMDDGFGVDLSAIGDLNGDNISDLLVGASNAGANDAGRAYIFYGRRDRAFPTSAAAADVIIDAEALGESLGINVLLDDLNRDGRAEAIVGDAAYNSNEGRVYVFTGPFVFGQTSRDAGTAENILSGDPNVTGFLSTSGLTADEPGDLTAGDVNGDGVKDLAVGSPRYGPDGFVHVFYSSLSGVGTRSLLQADIAISGDRMAQDLDDFGSGVVIADLNNDGIPDIGAGDPDPSGGGADDDGLYMVFFGSDPMFSAATANSPSVFIDNGSVANPMFDNEDFGSEARAGDVNGDGIPDLVIGDEEGDDPVFDTGEVYIFFGPLTAGDTTLATADVKITGVTNHDTVGRSLSVRDYTGDGIADVVIGAEEDTNGGGGMIYVFRGRTVWASSLTILDANRALSGAASGSRLGSGLAE